MLCTSSPSREGYEGGGETCSTNDQSVAPELHTQKAHDPGNALTEFLNTSHWRALAQVLHNLMWVCDGFLILLHRRSLIPQEVLTSSFSCHATEVTDGCSTHVEPPASISCITCSPVRSHVGSPTQSPFQDDCSLAKLISLKENSEWNKIVVSKTSTLGVSLSLCHGCYNGNRWAPAPCCSRMCALSKGAVTTQLTQCSVLEGSRSGMGLSCLQQRDIRSGIL